MITLYENRRSTASSLISGEIEGPIGTNFTPRNFEFWSKELGVADWPKKGKIVKNDFPREREKNQFTIDKRVRQTPLTENSFVLTVFMSKRIDRFFVL